MSVNKACLAFSVSLILSACATTDSVAPATADGADAAQAAKSDAAQVAESTGDAEVDPDDPDAIRCKRITKTGTRFSTKVCATVREWEQSAQTGRENTEKLQRRPQQGPDIN